MGRIGREIGRVLVELESDLGEDVPQSIVWNGQTLPCVPKKSISDAELSIGGLSESGKVTFIIRRALFANDLPQPKDRIKASGGPYWVSTVNESADHSYIRLDCNISAEGV